MIGHPASASTVETFVHSVMTASVQGAAGGIMQLASAPGFDTKAGWLRPPKPGTSEHYANKLLDKILKEGT